MACSSLVATDVHFSSLVSLTCSGCAKAPGGLLPKEAGLPHCLGGDVKTVLLQNNNKDEHVINDGY